MLTILLLYIVHYTLLFRTSLALHPEANRFVEAARQEHAEFSRHVQITNNTAVPGQLLDDASCVDVEDMHFVVLISRI